MALKGHRSANVNPSYITSHSENKTFDLHEPDPSATHLHCALAHNASCSEGGGYFARQIYTTDKYRAVQQTENVSPLRVGSQRTGEAVSVPKTHVFVRCCIVHIKPIRRGGKRSSSYQLIRLELSGIACFYCVPC